MRIGITDTFKPNFEFYVQWLKRANNAVGIVKLSYALRNLDEIHHCDGLLLTGGGDVDPRWYRRPDAIADVYGVDDRRDRFEFAVIDRALERGVPILGICRGLQVVNVKFGGSLIVDLAAGGFANHRPDGDEELRHALTIEPATVLAQVIGQTTAEVNSTHHQAADEIGRDLKVSARSPDGVIEAMEWHEQLARPFLLLIQWHPERMKDFFNPASFNILQTFLLEVQRSIEVRS